MIKIRFSFLISLAFICANSPSTFAVGPYKESPGPFAIATVKYDWHDAKRDRDVPVKIYYPKTGDGSFPVIIFSHGLGGSRDNYAYLGNHWASHGYICVHPQHLGSDSTVWQDVPAAERMNALRKSALNLQNALNRPLDVTYVIDQITKLNSDDSTLKRHFDLDRIGVAGHSFGGYTALASAGEVFLTLSGGEHSSGDSRIKASIPMSPPAPLIKNDLDRAFGKIKIPCFIMTGTLDDSPIGETKAADRRVPYDHIKNADHFLLTFNGGDHMVFSGRLAGQPAREKDPIFQKLILESSTAFWDAYLKGDSTAKTWLTTGFENILSTDGKFEEELLKVEK